MSDSLTERTADPGELANMLEDLYLRATPGHWRVSYASDVAVMVGDEDILVGGNENEPNAMADVAFVSFTHNVMPSIILHLRRFAQG